MDGWGVVGGFLILSGGERVAMHYFSGVEWLVEFGVLDCFRRA